MQVIIGFLYIYSGYIILLSKNKIGANLEISQTYFGLLNSYRQRNQNKSKALQQINSQELPTDTGRGIVTQIAGWCSQVPFEGHVPHSHDNHLRTRP